MKFLITTLLLTFTLIASAENKSSVGVGLLIEDIEISGSKIIPIPRTNYKTPIVLRVVSTEEIDGGFRYTIHAEGLDPGNYDLIKFLKRQDNTPLETDSIPFEVYSVLDAPLTEPQKLTTTKPDSIGGYTTLLWILAIIWIIGLLIILFYKKRTHSSEEIKTPPPSLAEKITALLKESKEKKSDTQSQAKLERLLIGHWMEKFPELENKSISDSLTFLRNNKESSTMIRSVERWLHSGKEVTEDEIKRTLAPYSSATTPDKEVKK